MARLGFGLWGAFLIAGFFVAARLEPAWAGWGTHQQLGLPACTFREVFGVPCPSCGMTTSFAYFVRGQFVRAAEANLAGLLLAVACAVQIPWATFVLISGRSRSLDTIREVMVWGVGALALAGGVQWGIRLLFSG